MNSKQDRAGISLSKVISERLASIPVSISKEDRQKFYSKSLPFERSGKRLFRSKFMAQRLETMKRHEQSRPGGLGNPDYLGINVVLARIMGIE